MRRRQLGNREDREALKVLLKQDHPGWVRTRLLVLKLGMHSSTPTVEIASTLEVSEASVYRWFRLYRAGGIEAVMERRYFNMGPQSGLDVEVEAFIKQGLETARWNTVVQTAEDLRTHFRRPFKYSTVLGWVKKCAGVFRIPRPVHEKKDPVACEQFKRFFLGKLKSLPLSGNRPIKVWFIDESRYGLLPVRRRVLTLKGRRPHKKWRTKYEWSYCYGAIEAITGQSVFLQTPSVSLEWTEAFLLEIQKAHPNCEHIIVWDGAGFHPNESEHPRIPEGFHVINLPPYSPELNPIEKLWDLVQDRTANKLWPSIERLDEVVGSILRDWIADPIRVLGLFGKGYHRASANGSFTA